MSDTLPAGLTYVTSSPNICSAAAQVVTCNGGAVEAADSTSITLTVAVDPSVVAGTVINNTATVATVSPTTDPNSGNNSSTDPTTVVNVTDLSISKSHTGTFVAGENAAYTMTVSNSGPSGTPTADVTVSDPLPAGMTYVATGSGGTGWTCSETSGIVTCDYAPALANGATTPTLTINVNIDPGTQGQVANTATVESILDDSNPPNDSSTDTTTIVAEADLTATKTAQGSLTAGEPVTYRFEVTNTGGPSQADSVTITDDLQGHFTYQSFASVSGGVWDCAEVNDTVTCGLAAPLTVGGTAIVDVTLEVAENAPNPVDNTAAVTFNGTDPTPANPTVSSPVAYSADLGVAIEREQKVYHSGETVEYKYIVTNYGPSAASSVVLQDEIPEGLIIDHISGTAPGGDSIMAMIDNALFPRASAAANSFSCSLSGQNLTCNADTLLPGVYILYVTAHIAQGFTGSLTTSLAISSATPDPNLSNNQAFDTITDIQPASGLAGTGIDAIVWIAGAVITVVASIGLYIISKRLKRQKA